MNTRLWIVAICLLATRIAAAQEADDNFRVDPNRDWSVEPGKDRDVTPNKDYDVKAGNDRSIRPSTGYGVESNEAHGSSDRDKALPASTRERERGAGVRHAESSNRRGENTASTATERAWETSWIELEPKIEKQLGKRGWTKESIKDTIQNPSRTVDTRDIRHLPGGTKRNDPATAYINSDGSYVVRNSMTMQIVQVSDRNNPNWKSPFD